MMNLTEFLNVPCYMPLFLLLLSDLFVADLLV